MQKKFEKSGKNIRDDRERALAIVYKAGIFLIKQQGGRIEQDLFGKFPSVSGKSGKAGEEMCASSGNCSFVTN